MTETVVLHQEYRGMVHSREGEEHRKVNAAQHFFCKRNLQVRSTSERTRAFSICRLTRRRRGEGTFHGTSSGEVVLTADYHFTLFVVHILLKQIRFLLRVGQGGAAKLHAEQGNELRNEIAPLSHTGGLVDPHLGVPSLVQSSVLLRLITEHSYGAV